jgi:hypothetical protein
MLEAYDVVSAAPFGEPAMSISHRELERMGEKWLKVMGERGKG